MKGLCLTEHAPGMEGGAPSFIPHSQRMLPREVEGIRVYRGIEANILDHQNRLDIPEEYLEAVRIRHRQHPLPYVPGKGGPGGQHRHLCGDSEKSLCGYHRPCRRSQRSL